MTPLREWLWWTKVETGDLYATEMWQWPLILPERFVQFICERLCCCYCLTRYRGGSIHEQEGRMGICQDCYILWYK